MTSRDVPDVAHLLGSADEAATVTVNSQSVTRQNAYWYKDLAVTNDTDPQYPEVVIDATWSNILSSVTGNVFVAQTPEDFGCDDDGNMTNDGRFAYTWDGENRLIAVETLPTVVAASGAPQVRVEYAYDHMSRRIGKTVINAYTNGTYATTNQTAYVYDGWNLISETQVSSFSTQVFSYVWGLDLSGSLQGAGGIGGLLSMVEGRAGSPSTPLFFTADANGNIGQLLDAANPTNILAHYEYSPFGETLVSVGKMAKDNPFRFSTKYHEDESGLVYYGYRYYKPDIGRWVNRDPLMDSGSPPMMAIKDQLLDFLAQYFYTQFSLVVDEKLPEEVRFRSLYRAYVSGAWFASINRNEAEFSLMLAGNNWMLFSANDSVNLFDLLGLICDEESGCFALFGNALNNTVTAMGQSWAQVINDLIQWQPSYGQWNQIYDLLWSVETPAAPEVTPYVMGSLALSTGTAIVAGGMIVGSLSPVQQYSLADIILNGFLNMVGPAQPVYPDPEPLIPVEAPPFEYD